MELSVRRLFFARQDVKRRTLRVALADFFCDPLAGP